MAACLFNANHRVDSGDCLTNFSIRNVTRGSKTKSVIAITDFCTKPKIKVRKTATCLGFFPPTHHPQTDFQCCWLSLSDDPAENIGKTRIMMTVIDLTIWRRYLLAKSIDQPWRPPAHCDLPWGWWWRWPDNQIGYLFPLLLLFCEKTKKGYPIWWEGHVKKKKKRGCTQFDKRVGHRID